MCIQNVWKGSYNLKRTLNMRQAIAWKKPYQNRALLSLANTPNQRTCNNLKSVTVFGTPSKHSSFARNTCNRAIHLITT